MPPRAGTRDKQRRDALAALAALRQEGAPTSETDWARIACEAGKLQRKARQLAGLGRGG